LATEAASVCILCNRLIAHYRGFWGRIRLLKRCLGLRGICVPLRSHFDSKSIHHQRILDPLQKVVKKRHLRQKVNLISSSLDKLRFEDLLPSSHQHVETAGGYVRDQATPRSIDKLIPDFSQACVIQLKHIHPIIVRTSNRSVLPLSYGIPTNIEECRVVLEQNRAREHLVPRPDPGAAPPRCSSNAIHLLRRSSKGSTGKLPKVTPP
jgi:hypothetical protein